jgi:hypothetical protein
VPFSRRRRPAAVQRRPHRPAHHRANPRHRRALLGRPLAGGRRAGGRGQRGRRKGQYHRAVRGRAEVSRAWRRHPAAFRHHARTPGVSDLRVLLGMLLWAVLRR